MVDQLTMRASDRDRQQVVDRLRSALEDGRLSMDEYVDRMEAAYKAATYGDLAPLCADLPAAAPVIAGPQTAAGAAGPPTVALEDGRLTMDEYVDRMEAAYKAATYGDLVPLCADLPASPPAIAGPQTAAGAGLPTVLKILWTIWLTAVAVNVVVWALVSGTGGHLAYALPVWVAGPYGAVLFAWLTAVSVNVVVWALVSGTGGHLAYPWPVWVAGPYGAVLFAVSAGVVLFRRSRPPVARTYARLVKAN